MLDTEGLNKMTMIGTEQAKRIASANDLVSKLYYKDIETCRCIW